MLRTGEPGRQSNAAALTSGLHTESGLPLEYSPLDRCRADGPAGRPALRTRCNAGGIGEHGDPEHGHAREHERTRCNVGGIGEHGLASARGRLEARLGRLIDAPPPLAAAERSAPARTGFYRIDTLVEGLMP